MNPLAAHLAVGGAFFQRRHDVLVLLIHLAGERFPIITRVTVAAISLAFVGHAYSFSFMLFGVLLVIWLVSERFDGNPPR